MTIEKLATQLADKASDKIIDEPNGDWEAGKKVLVLMIDTILKNKFSEGDLKKLRSEIKKA